MTDKPHKQVRTFPPVYESIIKVTVTDEPGRRARDIADGIGYACALLADEYGWDCEAIVSVLERVMDNVEDDFARREAE